MIKLMVQVHFCLYHAQQRTSYRNFCNEQFRHAEISVHQEKNKKRNCLCEKMIHIWQLKQRILRKEKRFLQFIRDIALSARPSWSIKVN